MKTVQKAPDMQKQENKNEMSAKENSSNKRMAQFLKAVAVWIENQIPEAGTFAKQAICEIPQKMGGEFSRMHTDMIGLQIAPDLDAAENARRLIAYVRFPGTDRQMSNYIFKGTNQEMMEYLTRPETCSEILEILFRLDHSMWIHD